MALKQINTLFFFTLNPNKTVDQVKAIGPTFTRGYRAFHYMLLNDINSFVIGDEKVKVIDVTTSSEVGEKQKRSHIHVTLVVDKICQLSYKGIRNFVNHYYKNAHLHIRRVVDEVDAIKKYSEKGHKTLFSHKQ